MVSNKKRLYLSIYPPGATRRTGERRYHWAFLIGPKVEKEDAVPGMRYHVKNPIGKGWTYEEHEVANVRNEVNRLGRVVIAKIVDEKRLVEIIRSTPVVQDDSNWRCGTWTSNVLSRLAADGRAVGTAELSWEKVEKVARDYVGKKTDEGRYESGSDQMLPKPTWDMLEGREAVP